MSDELGDFLAPYDPEIQVIVRKARSLLLEHIPNVVETQDKDNLGFGISSGYKGLIFTLTPQKKHVTMGIWDGASLPDPQGLLEGSGKRHKHVKISDEVDLENPDLKRLIEVAIESKVSNI